MWTADLERQLINLWNTDTKTAAQIAVALGPKFTRNAVIGKVSRLRKQGVPLRANANPQSSKDLTVQVIRRARKKRIDRMAHGAMPGADERPPLAYDPPPPDPLDPQVFHIIHLEKEHCRWPYGTPGQADFGWCGRQRTPGLVYCAHHAKRAFAPPFVRAYVLPEANATSELEPA